jgi:hypothetical protein
VLQHKISKIFADGVGTPLMNEADTEPSSGVVLGLAKLLK